MISSDDLNNRFTYHSPNLGQTSKYQALRDKGKELAEMITCYCPPSRETSLSITKLEEVIMWANASIARNE